MKKQGRVTVAGAGIVGLAVARAFALRDFTVTVIEKESRIASHQTGRNSGVIHSGPYYQPGSLKARLCVEGGNALKAYASEKGIDHIIGGKLIVATNKSHSTRIDEIHRRAALNGVRSEIVSGHQIKDIEPNCVASLGLWVPGTGTIDYGQVARNFADDIKEMGGTVILSSAVRSIDNKHSSVIVEHESGTEEADFFVNAAGVHSDRLAQLSGLRPRVRIIPFKGQYFEVAENLSGVVRGMVYPAPDPAMPFLGVHATRSLGGTLLVGPNAFLAMGRESYSGWGVDPKHLSEVMLFPGFWKFLAAHKGYALNEGLRSSSRRRFANELALLIEGIEAKDLRASYSGIRAQAMNSDGKLVDDFVIERSAKQVHILNAPSPAATASMSIAEWIVRMTISGM